MMDMTKIMPLIGILVALVNVITQVLKQLTIGKVPTNVIVVVLSLLLTVGAGMWYCVTSAIAVTWYIVASLVVGGFLVAYAAMFGFDKLRETTNWGRSNE
jgi:hypothetical protein